MKKIELINMVLFEIGRECQIVDALRTESLRHIEVIEARGKEVPDTFRKLKADHEEMLNDIHHMLRDVMEEIGEYMNAHDIVQGVDVAINKSTTLFTNARRRMILRRRRLWKQLELQLQSAAQIMPPV